MNDKLFAARPKNRKIFFSRTSMHIIFLMVIKFIIGIQMVPNEARVPEGIESDNLCMN